MGQPIVNRQIQHFRLGSKPFQRRALLIFPVILLTIGRILIYGLSVTGLTFYLTCFFALHAQTVSPSSSVSSLPHSPTTTPIASDPQQPISTPPPQEPTQEPTQEPCSTDCFAYTNRDLSQTGLTHPSLWWSVRELGEQLIPNWVVYPNEHRVEFTIDPQRWNWMNYFERYTLVTQLAYVLRPQGYSFYIFDPQQPGEPIASYTCEFAINPPACQLHFAD